MIIALFVGYAFWKKRPVKHEYVEPFSYSKEEVLAPFVLKREIYGDPDIFDQPRIQFVWRGPKRDNAEIWSVKIDGTDLRLAADAQLLYQGDEELGMHTHITPMRSPDNRYILVNMHKVRSFFHLIDLKEGTSKKIHDSRGNLLISYPWVSDSQSFFYQRAADSTLSRYYLKNGQVETIRKSNNISQYVQQTAEIISEFTGNEFVQWDFKGNELSRIYLDENIHPSIHSVSPDGNYFIYDNHKGAFFVPVNNVDSKEKIINTNKPIIARGGYGVFSGALNILFYDIKTKTKKFIYKKYGGHRYDDNVGHQMRRFSLFNEANTNGQ